MGRERPFIDFFEQGARREIRDSRNCGFSIDCSRLPGAAGEQTDDRFGCVGCVGGTDTGCVFGAGADADNDAGPGAFIGRARGGSGFGEHVYDPERRYAVENRDGEIRRWEEVA